MTTQTQIASVMDYLKSDHRRLDGIMKTCTELANAGDFIETAKHFAKFRDGLVRHIKIEEGLVFPELEAATGLMKTDGPTGVMRIEHEEILRRLGQIEELLAGENPLPDEFQSLRASLVSLLHTHNMKEEQIIYPMTDRTLTSDRLVDLVKKMRRFYWTPTSEQTLLS